MQDIRGVTVLASSWLLAVFVTVTVGFKRKVSFGRFGLCTLNGFMDRLYFVLFFEWAKGRGRRWRTPLAFCAIRALSLAPVSLRLGSRFC